MGAAGAPASSCPARTVSPSLQDRSTFTVGALLASGRTTPGGGSVEAVSSQALHVPRSVEGCHAWESDSVPRRYGTASSGLAHFRSEPPKLHEWIDPHCFYPIGLRHAVPAGANYTLCNVDIGMLMGLFPDLA